MSNVLAATVDFLLFLAIVTTVKGLFAMYSTLYDERTDRRATVLAIIFFFAVFVAICFVIIYFNIYIVRR